MLKLLNFSCSRCLFPSDHSDHFLVNINNRVEERQEMTAAIAPGAARGRAREGASRRKELEDDHDQEH